MAVNQNVGVVKETTIKENIIQDMKDLGTYKLQFNGAIEILTDMLEQYSVIMTELKRKNYKLKATTAAGGDKKPAMISTLEALRKDINVYMTNLGLNPKGFESLTVERQTKSKLAEALKDI